MRTHRLSGGGARSRVEAGGSSINVASLVGHNTVRRQVLGLAHHVESRSKQDMLDEAATCLPRLHEVAPPRAGPLTGRLPADGALTERR